MGVTMRLTSADASFLYSESRSGPMHSASISVLDGEVPADRIREHIRRRLHLVPRYRERLVFVPFNLAQPKWVDDPDFDLDYHTPEVHLPPGTSLQNAIAHCLELTEPLLPRDRPLWKTWVVQGVSGHTLMLQSAHHAMIDGASSVDLASVLLDFEADAPHPPPQNEPWNPDPLPNPQDLLAEAMRESMDTAAAFRSATALTPEQLGLVGTAMTTMAGFAGEPAITAPWNAGTVGPKRRLEYFEVALDEFREIRRVYGGTLNDVVLAVVTEAAARYLKHHGEPASGQYFRLMCPVNVREEGEAGTLGNRVSAIFPRIPAWTMDVIERLRNVSTTMARAKEQRHPQALDMMQRLAPTVPPVAMLHTLAVGTPYDPTAFAAQFPAPVIPRGPGPRPPLVGFNFTVTNVPGSQVPQYIAGHRVKATMGTLMLGGTLGFGVVVYSYARRLFFNMTGEPRLLPDLERMRQHAENVYGELLDTARAVTTAAKAG